MAIDPNEDTKRMTIRPPDHRPLVQYRLDPSRIETIQDVRKIFAVLDITYRIYAAPDRVRDVGAEHLFVLEHARCGEAAE